VIPTLLSDRARSQVTRPCQNRRGRSVAAARQCSISIRGMLSSLSPAAGHNFRSPMYAVPMMISLAARAFSPVYVTRERRSGSQVCAS